MSQNKLEAFSSNTSVGWIALSIVVLALGAFTVGELGVPLFSESDSYSATSPEGVPTLDKDRPRESITEIKASLSAEEREQFEDALSDLVVRRMLESDQSDADAVTAEVHARLDGMTAGEIISLADSIDASEN